MTVFCAAIVAFALFLETQSVRFEVVGPAEPLVVDVGSDLVLPCSLQPKISAEDMTVEWLRPDLNELQRNVLIYGGFEDKTEKQFESYRGRSALFKEELLKGNASLKLSAVQPSDEGAYKCLITSKIWFDDFTVYVEVKENVQNAGKIAIICICVFSILIITFAACFYWKDKFCKKHLSPIQCSVISYMHLQSENVRKELNLSKYHTSEEGLRRLIPAVKNCKKAILSDCDLTELEIEALATAVQVENSSLKSLDLSNINLQLRKLSDGLKSSQCKIEVLRLAGCKIDEKSCVVLQSVLQSENSRLRELDLGYNNLYDSGVAQLSVGFKSPHCKLEVLRLAGCKLKAESWTSIKHILLYQRETANLSLRELDLSNNDLSGDELLVNELEISQLETISFAGCNLGKNICEKLSSALQSAKSPLRRLDLSKNDLKDSGVGLLCDGLGNSHCKLEALGLSGCLVTKKGCSSLASALSSNPSYLKELDLTYNYPEDQGKKLLSAKLKDPQCKLHILRLENAGSIMIRSGLRKYACELTLDTNTANAHLCLSEGNRKVTRVFEQQSYPNHVDRFDGCKQVMCKESLSGRCYWEVECGGLAFVAVTYRRIQRKRRSNNYWFGRNKTSWCLYNRDNLYFAYHNNNQTVIPSPALSSKRVGVYLDYPAGTLSFYSVSSKTHSLMHLHTFQSTFTEPLYAGFWVGMDSSVTLCDIE